MQGERTGVGESLYRILENWPADAPAVTVLTSAAMPAPPPLGVPVRALPGGPLWHLRAAAAALRPATGYLSSGSPLVPLMVGRRASCIVYDLTAFSGTQWHTRHNVIIHRLFFDLGLRRLGAVVVTTRAIARQLQRHAPWLTAPVTLAPLGPRERVIAAAQAARAAAQVTPAQATSAAAVSAPPTAAGRPPFALYVGTLEPRKNVIPLIEAFIAAADDGWELKLAGRLGWLGENDQARLETLLADPRVEHLGYVSEPELAQLYARASLLCYVSASEGFGLPVLEAMAAGVAVLHSDDPAILEVAGGAGASVALTRIETELPAQLRALTRDRALRERLATAGRRRAGDFSWARTAAAVAAAVQRPVQAQAPAAAGPAAPPDWAIITVTHNSAPELARLLDSVTRHTPEARVIVVDNASSDDSVAVATAWHRGGGRLELVALGENVGFGAGCNRGLERAGEAAVALLNPDVELLDDSLRTLVRRVLSAPAAQLLGPRVLGDDDSLQHTAHPLPCTLAELAHALIPPAVLPARLAAATIAPWRSTRERGAGWLVGCAIVATAATLRELGPFDEAIFLYGEDLDLSLRAHAAGVAVRFCPQARVRHGGGHASTRSFGAEPFARQAAARSVAVAKNLGRRAAYIDTALQALTFGSRMLLKTLGRRPSGRERAQLAALRAAWRPRDGETAPPSPRNGSPA